MTLDEAIKHEEKVAKEQDKAAKEWRENQVRKCEIIRFAEMDYTHENECKKCADEHRQLAEWLKDYKCLLEQESILDKIRADIKEWYWQADKQALAKDPCVVDAMIDLFIRTIDKYKAESEE